MSGGDLTLERIICQVCSEIWPSGGGFYLEAGANDGIRQSNTLELETAWGWTGILIEPSFPAFELLAESRPNNLLVNAALINDSSATHAEGTFTDGSLMGSMDQKLRYRDGVRMSRWSIEHLRRRIGLRPRIETSKVPAIRLEELLALHEISEIDLMILDVEGSELRVLQGLESVSPRLVVIETRSDDSLQIAEFMLARGYILCGNFSKFSKESHPLWQGDHQDFCWCKAHDSQAIVAVANVLGT
jgi:FkbM family methyltransferase